MFAAFKMGLYFKVFITLVLLLRFASHSSQRAYPSTSIGREDHFFAVSSAPVSPALRIVVITQGGYSDNLKSLLQSLSEADYDRDAVALDVWMFASSTCNYVPLPLYPLAMAIFGPPRFDHAIPGVVHSVNWPHGEKTLVAVRSEPDWTRAWESSRGTMNETLLFLDAALARSVSPSFYIWLKRARVAINRGMMADAGVLSLDAVNIPDGVPVRDRAVLLEQFFPATAAFSPTQDTWITFLKWHALQTRSWVARPKLGKDLALGGYNFIESLRVHPVRAWFAQFLALYNERVLHPVLAENQTLLLRSAGTTGPRVAGTGGRGEVRIDAQSELEASRFDGTLKDMVVPERPVLIKSTGIVTTADMTFGNPIAKIPAKTRHATIEDLVDKDAAAKYRDVLRRIGEFARSRGTQSISLTLTTQAFVETTLSWLCNVVLLDIAPPAIVIVASDDKVADSLDAFLTEHPRLKQGSLVISMQGAVRAMSHAQSPDAALDHGSSAYWMLRLQRTSLLRDLLGHGVSILLFETDQIWLSDPTPFIQHELQQRSSSDSLAEDYRLPDMVITRNTRKEVAGNFLYMRPTVSTRQLLSTVIDRFYASYQVMFDGSTTKRGELLHIANDQSLLTTLILEHDWVYSKNFPGVKYTVLNEQLFVDGTWFRDFEDDDGNRATKRTNYQSESSLYPVVLNNNFLDGVDARIRRAQRFGFWFLKASEDGSAPQCDEVAVKKAAHSGSSKEHLEEQVVEIGKPPVNV